MANTAYDFITLLLFINNKNALDLQGLKEIIPGESLPPTVVYLVKGASKISIIPNLLIKKRPSRGAITDQAVQFATAFNAATFVGFSVFRRKPYKILV